MIFYKHFYLKKNDRYIFMMIKISLFRSYGMSAIVATTSSDTSGRDTTSPEGAVASAQCDGGILPHKPRANGETKNKKFGHDGYNSSGFDRNGFDREGFDYDGFGLDGYNREGFDYYGCGRDGYRPDGFDRYGFDRDGMSRFGIKKENLSILELPALTAALSTHFSSASYASFKTIPHHRARTKEYKSSLERKFDECQKDVVRLLAKHGIQTSIFPNMTKESNYTKNGETFDYKCASLRLQEIALGQYEDFATWFLANRDETTTERMTKKDIVEEERDEIMNHKRQRAQLIRYYTTKKSAFESATMALSSALPSEISLDTLLKSISAAKKKDDEFNIHETITALMSIPSISVQTENVDDWEEQADLCVASESLAPKVDEISSLYAVYFEKSLELHDVLTQIDAFNSTTSRLHAKKRHTAYREIATSENRELHFQVMTLTGAMSQSVYADFKDRFSKQAHYSASCAIDRFALIDVTRL